MNDFANFNIPKIDFEKMVMPDYSSMIQHIPEIETIDPEDTILGDIKRATEEQIKLGNRQIEMLSSQNQLLADNYGKLKEMYEAQKQSYDEAREDLKRSRRFNVWTMIIAIIAMLAAIASPIATILVAK